MTPLRELNELDREAFVERVGFAFEASPWVAAAAWDARPFASVAELHAAMVRALRAAHPERHVELIRAHPELADRSSANGSLTPASASEQAGAGLDRLSDEDHVRLRTACAAYRERFGFPYVVCVREHTVGSILDDVEERLGRPADVEQDAALEEIGKIAALRLRDAFGGGALADVDYEISYGKAGVNVYRQYATPLEGVTPVPESRFTGRPNVVFAHEIAVEVLGENFLPAYTEGDNSGLVATDSMKNFVLRQGRDYAGATLEGYLAHLGAGLLARYEQMRGVRVSGCEIPFAPVVVPQEGGGFAPSEPLHERRHGDRTTASVTYERGAGGARVVAHECGRVGMELLKAKGSSFTSFVRDEYTTLPDRADRPLFIGLDLRWTYRDVADALGPAVPRYVPGEQVRDVCAAVFHGMVSESIQELVHAMGGRLLERYPQLSSVAFQARNLTRDPFSVPEDPADDRKVFCDPFPAFGTINLKLTRRG